MTPPSASGSAVALRARFGEMPECWLEARCGRCASGTHIPIKLLARKYGRDVPVGAILGRLSCKRCSTEQTKVRPAEVWLNETPNRLHGKGGSSGWSVQLIGEGDADRV